MKTQTAPAAPAASTVINGSFSLASPNHSIQPITKIIRIPIDSSSGSIIVFEKKLILDNQLRAYQMFMEEYLTLLFDRPLCHKTVEKYMKLMMGDRWRGEQTTLISAEYKGVIYRMNGQRTLTAFKNVVAMPKYRNYTLTVNHLHYRVKTENELRRIYMDIDGGQKRTTSNRINASLYGGESFPKLNKSQIQALATGLRGHAYGFTQSRLSDEELTRLMTGIHYETCSRVGEFLQTGVERHITRGPVYAAMLSTFEKYKEDSIRFWSKVSSQAELTSDDPRLMLAKKLLMNSVNAGRGGGSSKSHCAAPEEMYRWCIDAFNAWKNGFVCQFKTFRPDLDRPVVK